MEYNEKKLVKIQKVIGSERCEELNALSEDELKKQIVDSTKAIAIAKTELEANDKYQEIKEALKCITASYRELREYQTCITDFCVLRLQGEETANDA